MQLITSFTIVVLHIWFYPCANVNCPVLLDLIFPLVLNLYLVIKELLLMFYEAAN